MGWKSPKKSSLEKAYADSAGALTSFLRKFLDNGADVEDLLQETFLRTFKAQQNQIIASPRAFMFRTARNLAINELEKRSKRRTEAVADVDVLEQLHDEVNLHGPEAQSIIHERLQRSLSAINRLPPRVREVFVLRRVHGLKQREIAQRLQIAESTVEKHIAKGLARMSSFDLETL